jgi:hypothetical protein
VVQNNNKPKPKRTPIYIQEQNAVKHLAELQQIFRPLGRGTVSAITEEYFSIHSKDINVYKHF